VSEFTLHRTGTFAARDEAGTAYTVVVYARYLRDAAGAALPAETELLTDRGVPVERVDKGRYTLFLPGGSVPLTSDDPAAP
jgi:hypothetical protein